MKKLYRSRTNRVIAGVCAGLADYINADPTMVRLIFALLLLVSGIFPMLILYIVAIFIVPEEPVTPNVVM